MAPRWGRDSPARDTGGRAALNDELRREHQLVRSAGVISKRVIAMWFGVAFILVGVGVVLTAQQGALAATLVALGAISTGWAMYAWLCSSQRHGCHPESDHKAGTRTP